MLGTFEAVEPAQQRLEPSVHCSLRPPTVAGWRGLQIGSSIFPLPLVVPFTS